VSVKGRKKFPRRRAKQHIFGWAHKKRSKKAVDGRNERFLLWEQPVEALSPPPIHRSEYAASQTTRRVAFEKVGGSAGSGLLSSAA